MIKRLIGLGTLALIVATSACDNRSVVYPTAVYPRPTKMSTGGGAPKPPAKEGKTKDHDKSKKAGTEEAPKKGDDSKD